MPESPHWRFPRLAPAHVNQDPVQGEFFTASSGLPQRVVREAIQNSLDARAGSEPVRVRFAFSNDEQAVAPRRAARYLKGLKRHLSALSAAAEDTGRTSAPSREAKAIGTALSCLERPMTYLAIEDFGTTGLTGDISANPERAEGNDFWGFFRSVGISTKSEDAGGSWGLGKWVFPDASLINAYFGLTRREREENYLLMGMALLKTHRIAGSRYPPYGYFAAHSTEDDDEWLALPIDSDRDPDGFLDAVLDLDLKRMDGAGLSVIIPFPKKELKPESIARAVLTQYFYPIVRKDLVVEIRAASPDTHPAFETIDSKTIEQAVEALPGQKDDQPRRDDESSRSLSGVVRLAAWADRRTGEDHGRLNLPVSKESFGGDVEVEDLRLRFERGERLAFRCVFPKGVRRRGAATANPADFRLYIERDEDLEKGHDYFVRGHLRIPAMDHIDSHRARALISVARDSELAHLLRDSEGPAHAKWDPHAHRLKERWTGGYQRVQSVRRVALLLLQLLLKRGSEAQLDALADLFPGDLDPKASKSREGRAGPRTPDPPPFPDQAPSPIIVVRRPDGFVLRPNGDHGPSAGSVVMVNFAYDVARGNPFRVYASGLAAGTPDFSLETKALQIESRNCEHATSGPNALRVTVEKSFELAVRGFDGRDLVVDLNIEDAETAEAAAPE